MRVGVLWDPGRLITGIGVTRSDSCFGDQPKGFITSRGEKEKAEAEAQKKEAEEQRKALEAKKKEEAEKAQEAEEQRKALEAKEEGGG